MRKELIEHSALEMNFSFIHNKYSFIKILKTVPSEQFKSIKLAVDRCQNHPCHATNNERTNVSSEVNEKRQNFLGNLI